MSLLQANCSINILEAFIFLSLLSISCQYYKNGCINWHNFVHKFHAKHNPNILPCVCIILHWSTIPAKNEEDAAWFRKNGKQKCCKICCSVTYLSPCLPPLLGLMKTSRGIQPSGGVIWNELWPYSGVVSQTAVLVTISNKACYCALHS